MENPNLKLSIVDRSLDDIVKHIQYSIANVTNIVQLIETFEQINLQINSFTYSPNLANIGLALKSVEKISQMQKDVITQMSKVMEFKILLMSENQLIIKWDNKEIKQNQ